MKKILVIASSLALAGLSAQAQGLFNFNNSVSATTHMSTNSVAGGAATGQTLGAGSYYYALFLSSSATTVANVGSGATAPTASAVGAYVFSDVNWTLAGYATNSATLGRVAGNAAGVAPNGFAGASSAQFVVLGWSANLGSTIAQVQSALTAGTFGYIGESQVSGATTLGDGGLTPTPSVFSAIGGGFTLGATPAVPEPGTMALAALGGASLLLFRRKK
jgi:hypothetical protein